jgi:hypothetical protein
MTAEVRALGPWSEELAYEAGRVLAQIMISHADPKSTEKRPRPARAS